MTAAFTTQSLLIAFRFSQSALQSFQLTDFFLTRCNVFLQFGDSALQSLSFLSVTCFELADGSEFPLLAFILAKLGLAFFESLFLIQHFALQSSMTLRCVLIVGCRAGYSRLACLEKISEFVHLCFKSVVRRV